MKMKKCYFILIFFVVWLTSCDININVNMPDSKTEELPETEPEKQEEYYVTLGRKVRINSNIAADYTFDRTTGILEVVIYEHYDGQEFEDENTKTTSSSFNLRIIRANIPSFISYSKESIEFIFANITLYLKVYYII